MTRRATRTPRRIPAGHVRVGDLCRFTTKLEDCTQSMVGVVARRETNRRATYFYTKSGALLGVDWGDGLGTLVITLLDNASDAADAVLEGIEI